MVKSQWLPRIFWIIVGFLLMPLILYIANELLEDLRDFVLLRSNLVKVGVMVLVWFAHVLGVYSPLPLCWRSVWEMVAVLLCAMAVCTPGYVGSLFRWYLSMVVLIM